jgi:hypothetical protein
MASLKFKLTEFGNTSIKKVNDAETLNDVLFHFTDFLRGAGFYFDGQVGIVNDADQLTFDFNTNDNK